MAESINDPVDDADPEALRADIRNTRDRVGDTLEQLGERLNPTHIKEQVREQVVENVTQLRDQVRETIRDATIGRVEHMAQNAATRVNSTRHSIADTIRENPIPAALVGVGLGWLFMNRSHSNSYEASRSSSRGYAGGYQAGGYQGGSAGYSLARPDYSAAAYADQSYDTNRGTVDQARERVTELGHNVRDSAGQLVDRAQHAAGSVADRAQQAASSVADRAQELGSTVADQTRYQARRVEDRFYESPLVVGAATLALGLAAGFAVPATHREVELMGDARDRLVDRAKEAAHESTEKVQEKVQEVAGRVINETKSAVSEATTSNNA